MPELPPPHDRLGLAHALKVTIQLATFVAPTRHERKVERGLGMYDAAEEAIAERVMVAIRRKFRVTWPGSDDESDNAREVE